MYDEYSYPSEDTINHWNIANDHAGDAPDEEPDEEPASGRTITVTWTTVESHTAQMGDAEYARMIRQDLSAVQAAGTAADLQGLDWAGQLAEGLAEIEGGDTADMVVYRREDITVRL